MQSDYMYMNDNVYTLSDDVRLMFHTVAAFNNGSKTYSNYNEYKTNNRSECNTMIKRTLSYYLFFEDRRDKIEKVSIFPEQMFELLSYFEHIKRNWIESDNFNIYAFMDSALAVVNYDEYIYMRLPLDKAIKIQPGVLKTDMGDVKCIDLYLNSINPVQITHSTFLGMYYVLQHFDMLNYANTALSFMMLMNTPINRTDFSTAGQNATAMLEDRSVASGSVGRTMSGKRKSFFDK